jgi:hypothetical protein
MPIEHNTTDIVRLGDVILTRDTGAYPSVFKLELGCSLGELRMSEEDLEDLVKLIQWMKDNPVPESAK